MKIFSADNFFISATGEYKFDMSKIGEAHQKCLRDFTEAVVSGKHQKVTVLRGIPGTGKSTYCAKNSGVLDLVVDNTNIQVWEMAAYCQLGLAHGLTVEVVTLLPRTYTEAAARNVHGVPDKACERMWQNLNRATPNIPKNWNNKIFEV